MWQQKALLSLIIVIHSKSVSDPTPCDHLLTYGLWFSEPVRNRLSCPKSSPNLCWVKRVQVDNQLSTDDLNRVFSAFPWSLARLLMCVHFKLGKGAHVRILIWACDVHDQVDVSRSMSRRTNSFMWQPLNSLTTRAPCIQRSQAMNKSTANPRWPVSQITSHHRFSIWNVSGMTARVMERLLVGLLTPNSGGNLGFQQIQSNVWA